jgi:hypothetical protein
MNKWIDCTCGIYNTEYQLMEHRDGSVSVKVPTIKWQNNSGNLGFDTCHVTKEPFISFTKDFFKKDCLCDDSGSTLDEILFNFW